MLCRVLLVGYGVDKKKMDPVGFQGIVSLDEPCRLQELRVLD